MLDASVRAWVGTGGHDGLEAAYSMASILPLWDLSTGSSSGSSEEKQWQSDEDETLWMRALFTQDSKIGHLLRYHQELLEELCGLPQQPPVPNKDNSNTNDRMREKNVRTLYNLSAEIGAHQDLIAQLLPISRRSLGPAILCDSQICSGIAAHDVADAQAINDNLKSELAANVARLRWRSCARHLAGLKAVRDIRLREAAKACCTMTIANLQQQAIGKRESGDKATQAVHKH